MAASLDLEAYLERIRWSGPMSATWDTLAALLDAHMSRIPFENLDVLLGRPVNLDLGRLQDKLVRAGRGGYCFEHGTLFAAALERLCYTVTRRLGRVGDPDEKPRTHTVVVVTLDDEQLLCDPGFGFSTLRAIPLVDGAEDDYGGRTLQLREVPEGAGRAWELHRRGQDGWELAHTHDELPVRPVDLRSGHHFTSTFPTSHFRHMLILTRHLPDRHVTVTHEAVTVRRPGEPTEHRPLRAGELPELLDLLDVPLIDDEREALLRRVSELSGQSE